RSPSRLRHQRPASPSMKPSTACASPTRIGISKTSRAPRRSPGSGRRETKRRHSSPTSPAVMPWCSVSPSSQLRQAIRCATSPETETFLDTTAWLYEPRSGDAAPTPLFGPLLDKTLGLARLDVAQVIFAPDSRWMVARTTDTTVPEGRLFVAPVSALAEAKIV